MVLRQNLYNKINSIGANNAKGCKMYLLAFDLVHDMIQSTAFVAEACYRHVANSHRPLAKTQQQILNQLARQTVSYLNKVKHTLEGGTYTKAQLDDAQQAKTALLAELSDLLDQQVTGIQTGNYGSKNSQLFFSIILETKDLVAVTYRFTKLFYRIDKDMPLLTTQYG